MDPSVDPETSALIASLIYADQQALAAQYNPYDSSQYEVGDDGSDPDDDYVPDRIKKQYERTTTAATSSTNRPVATKTKNQKGGDSPSRKRKSAGKFW